MNKLTEILEVKKAEIARLLPHFDELRRLSLLRDDFRSFGLSIDRGEGQLGLIAEVKRASPSAGDIVKDFSPVAIAREYERSGAHAISVLTDEKFFKGHLQFLRDIRAEVSLPLLRKDFILHEAQVYEAVVGGADAILLIVAALEQERLVALLDLAQQCQLEVLVEVHSLEELDRALETDAKIIGVNNRNLSTFEVDLAVTESLAEEVPEGILLVSESGIKSGADSQRLLDCGANVLLVGETLMRAPSIYAKVAELLLAPGA